MSKIDPELFSSKSNHRFPEKNCPDCGGKLQLKNSPSGRFLGCNNYPSCDYKESLKPKGTHIEQSLPGSSCPQCGNELAVKKGRYGLFIGCSQYPDCSYIADMEQTEQTKVSCPNCKTGELIQRNSRHGKKFFSCNQYPKCRYLVNQPPVSQSCPDCAWGILIEKKTANGIRYSCPQKNCAYKGRELPSA